MKLSEPRLPMALVKRLCPVCSTPHDAEILLSTRFVKIPEGDHAIDKLHGQPIGFDEKPCEKCMDQIGDKGAYLVGIIVNKSDDMSNPYRSGNITGVSWNYIDRVFDEQFRSILHKNKWVYIDDDVMQKLGLIQHT